MRQCAFGRSSPWHPRARRRLGAQGLKRAPRIGEERGPQGKKGSTISPQARTPGPTRTEQSVCTAGENAPHLVQAKQEQTKAALGLSRQACCGDWLLLSLVRGPRVSPSLKPNGTLCCTRCRPPRAPETPVRRSCPCVSPSGAASTTTTSLPPHAPFSAAAWAQPTAPPWTTRHLYSAHQRPPLHCPSCRCSPLTGPS